MIAYSNGDATDVANFPGQKFILHCCNDAGGWGSGFVLAVSKRWKEPEAHYRALTERNLGDIHPVRVSPEITVVNMIAQHGTRWVDGVPPVRYEALEECIEKVEVILGQTWAASVHCPRLCAGLAGGSWDKIEPILLRLTHPLFIYDYHDKTSRSYVSDNKVEERQ
jgi:O-acetyl-ADP-ribose deacetylase (regulator of RNase III)